MPDLGLKFYALVMYHHYKHTPRYQRHWNDSRTRSADTVSRRNIINPKKLANSEIEEILSNIRNSSSMGGHSRPPPPTVEPPTLPRYGAEGNIQSPDYRRMPFGFESNSSYRSRPRERKRPSSSNFRASNLRIDLAAQGMGQRQNHYQEETAK